MRKPAPPADPSLAGARTALSWRRSALSIAATGALLAKTGLDAGEDALGIGAACLLALAAIATWFPRGRLQTARGETTVHRRRALASLCAVSLLSAAISLAVILAST